jgi:hypothetical protein
MTMIGRRLARSVAVAALVTLSPPLSAAAQDLPKGSLLEAVHALKPGQYLWMPQIAPAGPMLVIVNRTTQRLVVYRNGVPIGISTVSTGKPGHATPTGVFTILQKQAKHFSNLYNAAPMPFMQRLTWDGVALHGGELPGHPASHGCVRLPQAFARLLFGETRLGMTVVVTDRDELPRIAPTTTHDLSPAPDGGGAWSWHPERAASGPISIVVSAADKRVVVLRNGVEIGAGGATIASTIDRPAAFTLGSLDAGGRKWVRLPLASQTDTGPFPAITAPAEFRDRLLPLLVVGTTVVITPESLRHGVIPQEVMSTPEAAR